MSTPYDRKFIANIKTFTDRTTYKEILKNAVEDKQKMDEYRIKVFYGVGGQGKSYLKDRFLIQDYLNELRNTDKNIVFTDAIDFEHKPNSIHPDLALLFIAKDLIEKGKLPLPAFCLGYLKYLSFTSSFGNLQELYPYLFKISTSQLLGDKLAGDVVNEVIDFMINSAASETLGSVPLVGYLIKKITNAGKDRVIEWFRQQNTKDILDDLDSLDRLSLLERLPILLGFDVYQYMQYNASEGNTSSKRIVIIIDGYETLWAKESNINLNKDKWVRDLIKYMPGAVFLIFGRDKLKWSEVEKDEGLIAGMEQIKIDGFTDQDADSYLRLVPIEDQSIREAIIRNAKAGQKDDGCLPLYLRLESSTYETIINSGKIPTSEDFDEGNEKTETDIINRFFKQLNPEFSNAIEVLSLCNYIDEDIIELLEKEGGLNANSVSLRTLNDYSFVNIDGNKARIHGLVKDYASELFKIKHPRKYTRINQALFDYFDQQLSFTEYQEIDTEIEITLEHAGYHKLIADESGFAKWIASKARYLYGKGYYDVLTSLLRTALRILYNNKEDSDENQNLSLVEKQLIATVFAQLSSRFEWVGNALEARKYINSSIKLYEDILTKDFLLALKDKKTNNLLSTNEYGLLQEYEYALESAARINAKIGSNLDCLEFADKAKSIASQFELDFDNYTNAEYLMNMGMLAEAEPVFFDSYQASIESERLLSENKSDEELAKLVGLNMNDVNFNSDVLKRAVEKLRLSYIDSAAKSAADLAMLLRLDGRFSEAIYYNNETIALEGRARPESHLYVAYAYHSLAVTYIEEGKNLDKAERILYEVWEIYKNHFNDQHLTLGRFYKDLCKLELNKNLKNAFKYYNKAADILIKNLGGFNKDYLDLVIHLNESFTHQTEEAFLKSNIKKAYANVLVNLFIKDFEYTKNLYGIYNPTFHRGMELAAGILRERNQIAKSEQLANKKGEFSRILKKRTDIRVYTLDRTVINNLENKSALAKLFMEVTSLPTDTSDFEIEKTDLPFYKTYDLYRIKFLKTPKEVYKYVLYDDKHPIAINWKNSGIYTLGENDLNLDDESVKFYATFFFDSVSGKKGKFYLLHNHDDIPWRIDEPLTAEYKSQFTTIVEPIQILFSDENQYVLKCNMLFLDSIFETKVRVNKKDGLIDLFDEALVYENISACVDPIYHKVNNEKYKDPFYENLMTGLEYAEEDITRLSTITENSDDENERHRLVEITDLYNQITNQLALDKGINLSNAYNMFILYHNELLDVFKKIIEEVGMDHAFSQNLSRRMTFLRNLVAEIKSHMAKLN